MVVIIINIVNHLQTLEAVMEAMGVFIPEVVKIIINRQVKVVMDKIATVVGVILEIAVVAVTGEEVMVMEEVATIAAAVDTVAATLVEDMAEVKVVVVEVDMAIVEDMVTALVEDTTVAVAVVVITKEATVTVTVVAMEWLYKKIPYSYLVWIHLFQKKRFVNILERLDSSSMINALENQKCGCIKIKTPENLRERQR